MHPIVYDVAVSLDGFISGPDGDVSRFAHEGPVVDDYTARLATYSTAIMGRATYEFGYRFGLEPGQNPYALMTTHVFSDTLQLPKDSEVIGQPRVTRAAIARVKQDATGPIYLCGGGAFAGILLDLGLIDLVRLKRAPVVLGGGVALFGNAGVSSLRRLAEPKIYASGYLLEEFAP